MDVKCHTKSAERGSLNRSRTTLIEADISNHFQNKSLANIIVLTVPFNTSFINLVGEIVEKLIVRSVDGHHLCALDRASNTTTKSMLSNERPLLYPGTMLKASFDSEPPGGVAVSVIVAVPCSVPIARKIWGLWDAYKDLLPSVPSCQNAKAVKSTNHLGNVEMDTVTHQKHCYLSLTQSMLTTVQSSIITCTVYLVVTALWRWSGQKHCQDGKETGNKFEVANVRQTRSTQHLEIQNGFVDGVLHERNPQLGRDVINFSFLKALVRAALSRQKSLPGSSWFCQVGRLA